jgi:small-conductance mechanosensitive channel
LNYLATLRAQVNDMWYGFIAALPNLAIALVIVILTMLVARFAIRIADKITGRTHLRVDLQQLIETLVRVAIWIIGLLLAAAVAVPGFTPAGLIAGLGIGALAIGFAFQDTFENFLAGVFVMLRDKMNIGDLIEVEGITGRVEKITLRETYLRKLSNELYVVPNAMLFKNPVQIFTDAPMRRDEITVGVAYDADLDAAQAAIRKAFDPPIDGIVTTKPVGVFCREFGGSSIDWLVQWWSENSPAHDMRDVRTAVIKAIKRELDAVGIDIPYPIVTNMFPEPLNLQRQAQEKAAEPTN